jgi:hypothetical protein
MTIDTFVYDPAAGGNLDAKLVKGAFRFISGKVARRDPRKMNVALPSGTIGIRGTIVYALVSPTDGRSTVALAGPGDGNTSGTAAGAIDVTNAGVTQEVLRSGWGVEVPGFDQPPSPPFPVPANFFDSFQFEVEAEPVQTASGEEASGDEESGDSAEAEESAAPGDPNGGSESASSGSEAEPESSPAAEAGATLDSANVALASDGILIDSISNVELPLADPTVSDTMTPPPPPPAGPVFTPTLTQELVDLAGTFFGSYTYQVTDDPLASGGDFDLLVTLNFGQQVVAVQLSQVTSPVLNTSLIGIGSTAVPLNNEGIEAVYDLQFMFNDSSSMSCLPSGCPANVQLLFENKDAELAGVVSGNVSITSPQLGLTDTGIVDDFPITTIQP